MTKKEEKKFIEFIDDAINLLAASDAFGRGDILHLYLLAVLHGVKTAVELRKEYPVRGWLDIESSAQGMQRHLAKIARASQEED